MSYCPHMRIDAVRVARQTDQLDAVVAFYRDVVGLPVIGGFDDHDGYTGVMLGAPGEAAHLEFTTHSSGSPGQPGGADDLLVLYADREGVQEVVARARALGIEEVPADNPYWGGVGGVVLVDPDGRRLVLVPASRRA